MEIIGDWKDLADVLKYGLGDCLFPPSHFLKEMMRITGNRKFENNAQGMLESECIFYKGTNLWKKVLTITMGLKVLLTGVKESRTGDIYILPTLWCGG